MRAWLINEGYKSQDMVGEHGSDHDTQRQYHL